MKIYLLRHGQTDWNVQGRLQGRMDIPMNRNGRKQIQEIADCLHELQFTPDIIISSPLDRAKESAEIVAEQIGYQTSIVYDEGFLERSFGLAEGLIYNENINLDDPSYGAERVEDVCIRAKKAIEKYISDEEKSILIVAHGAVLSAVKSALSQGELGYYDDSVPIIQGNVLCCELNRDEKPVFYNLFD